MGINDSTAKSIYYKFKSTGMYSKTSKKRRNWKASNPTSSHGGDSKLAELKEGQVGHFDTNSEYVDRSSESKQSKTLNQDIHANSHNMQMQATLTPGMAPKFDSPERGRTRPTGIPLYS